MDSPNEDSPTGAAAKPKRRVQSIRRAFTKLLIFGISVPALLIWAVGQWTSGQAVSFLWERLSSELVNHTIESTLRYIESSETALDYNDAMLELGLVDVEDGEALIDYLLQGLAANPNAAWYSFGTPEGAYLSAYHDAQQQLMITWRVQEGEQARYRNWSVAEDGTRTALPERHQVYDPRTKPWYENALAREGSSWTKPFLFASGPPGIIRSRAARAAGGELLGVWAIEYEMGDVSQFLEGLTVGRNGRAYLLTQEGEVIGHPLVKQARGEADDLMVKRTEAGLRIATAEENADPWLSHAFRAVQAASPGASELSFELEGSAYLVGAREFPGDTGLPWVVVVVIPEDDILGSIRRSFLLTGLAAILVASLVLALGLAYANRRISKPFAAIARDLESMSRLNIEEQPKVTESRLAEVADLMSARELLRSGLWNFKRYVPAQLVRDLLEQGLQAQLGGSRRRLTVFFSDVVGFTKISEDLGSPRALVDLLGDYFEVLSSTISESGGTVDKYIGDSVMAFWGAPKEMPNHALACARAAWRCQQRLERMHRDWPADHPRFHTRIGLNTGEVIVGNVGWQERMNYTVIGDAVNLASRLEALCKPYGVSILMSEDTWNEVKQEFLARPVDCVSVVGKRQPIVTYELLGPLDEVDQDCSDFARLTTRGFELYRAREFGAAATLYAEALVLRPQDRACELLRERCLAYESQPPDEDWCGVTRMTSKSGEPVAE